MTGNLKVLLMRWLKTADESQKGEITKMDIYTIPRAVRRFQYFDSIKDQIKFSRLARPYYVQMYYNDKDYDKQ